ncbi:ABC transporter permease [Larkinella arboricola]|uniref:ABC-2 type transport system permease protein n=1 Tax=Larkinella arboricola TaxID=643671 RepID=A0A327X2Y0_LARAB|nr:ABC transporter permease [Larkinella arboricola]RAJ99924.1 ABC-2 type transport system permease protein [Larkinella arboricola]
MRTIFLILKREYLVRVKKKSFLIMTFVTPLLVSCLWLVPIFFAMRDIDQKKVEVIDENGKFARTFKNTSQLVFTPVKLPVELAKKDFAQSGYDVLVHIPKDILENPKSLKIYAEKNVSLEVKNGIENAVEQEIENIRLLEAGIDRKVLESTKANVSSDTYSLSEEGEKDSSSGAATGIGYFCAFVIYMAIFIYGVQVMRGVMEEKTNRIVEVIISSVKPFQLMAGKITGVALVGLTQFMLWILLTFGMSSVLSSFLGQRVGPQNRVEMMTQPPAQNQTAPAEKPKSEQQNNPVNSVLKAISTLDIPLIIGCFLIYFIGGYLIYSALFAAVGSAVDSDTDVQQFMFPVTMPLVLSFIMAQFVIREPDGAVAFWMSMIPFTSPIIMMVRIPFGVPFWEIAASVVALIIGFLGTAWLAARIYRVGILMYGKKPSYKELAKWLFYKV